MKQSPGSKLFTNTQRGSTQSEGKGGRGPGGGQAEARGHPSPPPQGWPRAAARGQREGSEASDCGSWLINGPAASIYWLHLLLACAPGGAVGCSPPPAVAQLVGKRQRCPSALLD